MSRVTRHGSCTGCKVRMISVTERTKLLYPVLQNPFEDDALSNFRGPGYVYHDVILLRFCLSSGISESWAPTSVDLTLFSFSSFPFPLAQSLSSPIRIAIISQPFHFLAYHRQTFPVRWSVSFFAPCWLRFVFAPCRLRSVSATCRLRRAVRAAFRFYVV